MSDACFRRVERGIDADWFYSKVIPISVAGFNPFEGAYYYPRHSSFALWLGAPEQSARLHNENDLLVRETMFMVHDYLHAWTYQLVDRIWPECGLFGGEVREEALESFVFAHLLSEAAATVGLDYWFLSVENINDFCPIGTGLASLTVSYRERALPEYQKFQPDLVVQDPSFVTRLTRFYCTGIWPGLDGDDLKRSPQLYRWLKHELSYGVAQRQLTRAWFLYLGRIEREAVSEPVAMDNSQEEITRQVGESLWRLVKEGKDDLAGREWRRGTPNGRGSPRYPDFRFSNVAKLPVDHWSAGDWEQRGDTYAYFVYQMLSRIPFEEVPAKRRKHIPMLLQNRDSSLIADALGRYPCLEPGADEPLDLMIAN